MRRLTPTAFASVLRRRDDAPVIEAVSKHAADNPGHGFGLLYDSFRADRHQS